MVLCPFDECMFTVNTLVGVGEELHLSNQIHLNGIGLIVVFLKFLLNLKNEELL